MKVSTKVLSIVLSVIMLFGILPMTNVFASDIVANGTCGDNLTWTLDSEGTLTISGEGKMDTYDSAGDVPWNNYKKSIKTVNIGNGVTSIGSCAFEACSSLTNITIPDSVTIIGKYTFAGCSNLTSITIGNSVTSIGEGAFDSCSSLTSITIPNSVTSIGNWTFEYCSSLTSITIPNSVTSIGGRAFENCSSLTSIIIPDSVTSIGDRAFAYCCSLTSITIPDSVASIGDRAFAYCCSLTSITIPDSVASIGYIAFFGCSSFTNITVSENNPNYSSADGVLFNKDKTELIQYLDGNKRIEYTIPDSVTSIGKGAFDGCSSLASITIPDSVTSIGYSAFAYCKNLTSITIPDSVISIDNYAFYECTSLTSITIPDSVTSIGYRAFENCSSLTSITIPDSVITSIEEYAFYWCSSLTSVTIGNGVTSIGNYAFENCSSLTSIIIPSSVTSISNWAFSGCYDLVIYGYIGSYAQEYAEEKNIPFISLDDDAFVRLFGRNTTNDGTIRVYGFATPGETVSVLSDGNVIGTTKSSASGRWSFDGAIPNVRDGSTYTITAKVTVKEETATSDSLEVTYDSQAVILERLETRHNGQSYVITPETQGKAAGYISVDPAKPITFTVKLTNNQRAKNVRIVAESSKETKVYPATYNSASEMWIATAYFGSDFVPESIYILYDTENEHDLKITPDYKCRFIIDPSGNVFEAVKSNSLEGVTARIFHKDGNDLEILWNADAFDQINPQVTGADGSFHWDVPTGLWQVRFSKNGYEEARTEWLEVPPEYKNLVISMVTTTAPEVEFLNVYENGAEVRFSQYMDISSVNTETISIGGVSGTWTAVDAEESIADSSVMYAKTFTFTADKKISGEVEVSVSGCKNYAGIAMSWPYSAKHSMKTQLTSIDAPDAVEVEMGKSATINIALLPKDAASGNISIANLDSAIAKAPETAELSKSGTATISVDGLLMGVTELTITYSGTSLEKKIKIEVIKPTDDMHEHQYGEWTVTKEATCTEPGLKEKVCIICGTVVEEQTPTIAHDTERVNAKAATAEEEGYTGDLVCKICGQTIEKGSVIPVITGTTVKGDVDGDGQLSVKDARFALRIAAKLESATAKQIAIGDLDGDGKISIAEARKILRVAARIDTF